MHNLIYFFKKNFFCFSFLFLFVSIMTISQSCFAMTPEVYSYKKLHDALPESLQKNDFVYEENGAGFLAFCKYDTSGTNYRTTVKHSGNNLYYCVNYSNTFTPDKVFSVKDSPYNPELKARLSLALHLGTTTWNTKANKGYTTGNAVEDYYMTQVVIHGLIYKYGGDYKDEGVDFSNVVFKSGTGNLQKKTMTLFEACTTAIYENEQGMFQASEFSFDKTIDRYMLLDKASGNAVSEELSCTINTLNAPVQEFRRTSYLVDSSNSVIKNDVIIQTGTSYDSSYSFSVPVGFLDGLDPGVYSACVNEDIAFTNTVAEQWCCIDPNFGNNQEVAGINYIQTNTSDSNSMNIIIGSLELTKEDSITGEIIDDASFQLLEYDDYAGEYVFYKDLTYDPAENKYLSGNIYCSTSNPSGKFKVIETDAGATHNNDWDGQEFVIDKDHFNYEIIATNTPILGKLTINKKSDSVEFDDKTNRFIVDKDKLQLSGIKFEVYAAEDIHYKNSLVYKKDTHIFDLVTDSNGTASINNMIPGNYYIVESTTTKLHILDKEKYSFEIKAEENGYSQINYSFKNNLKKCNIKIYKHDKADEKLPISGCKFALYAKMDVYNNSKQLIVKKDTLISEGVTDKKGELIFKDLVCCDYYLKELSAPKGIIVSDKIINVKDSDFAFKADTNDQYEAVCNISNQSQLYNVKLYKVGQHFTGVTQEETVNGSYFNYNMEYAPLKNVTYSLYDSKEQCISTKTTDDQGIVSFEGLKYGDFICKEEKAPGMYEKNNSPITISCTELNKDNEKAGEPIQIKKKEQDKMCNCTVTIKKLGEGAYIEKKKLMYRNIPLEGVVYGIYQRFEYQFPSGEILPANSCVGYIITDNNGIGQYYGTLPEGQYYLKELKTLKGYKINEDEISFEIKNNNNKKIDVNFADAPFVNLLEKASVHIIKIDSDSGKPLKGVEFTLYNEKGEVVGVYKTNKKGKIFINELPYGKYYFVETKCLDGYYSTNNKYNFELNSNETKKMEITNTPIYKLGFSEHYKSLLIIVFVISVMFCLSIIYNQRCKKGLQ
ncbi:MAG: hypothetical protein K6G76_11610 [Lachnospiraceae bacterium]|nr:hypothetical protein [Lachnospiraceae bacterium]